MPSNQPIQPGLFAFDRKDPGGPLAPNAQGRNAQRVHSVTDINRIIKDRLLQEPSLQRVLVVGEVFEVSTPGSGHIYFGLKDTESIIRCVMWRSRAGDLKFKLEPGMKVIAFGNIGVYEKSGQYQIVVERLQPEGLGALHQAFERLRKKLESEGLFAETRKRPIPPFPRAVGLVTSPTGAAIQDIIRVSTSRWPQARILLTPATVQGETAANDVMSGLKLLNKVAADECVDVIIIARGGGSPEDLAAFNDEPLARAIASSKVPVVTGIGHEVDRTIADYIADRSAATPSQAAEMVFPDAREQRTHITSLMSAMSVRTKAIIVRRKERLDMLATSRALSRPKELVDTHRQALDDIVLALTGAIKDIIGARRHTIELKNTSLSSLDPKAILGRGYSITLGPTGEVVKDPGKVNVGDELEVLVHRGRLKARLVSKQRSEEQDDDHPKEKQGS